MSNAVSFLMFYTDIGELSGLEITFFDMKTDFCLKATAKYIVVQNCMICYLTLKFYGSLL